MIPSGTRVVLATAFEIERDAAGHPRQLFGAVLDVTDRAIILERGAVVYSGDSAALGNDRQVLEKYIGVSEGAPRRHGQSRRSH